MPWQITWEGHVHRENDLTLAQAERIEELIGESWLNIAPLRSAKHAKAILAVMHSAATGEPERAVLERTGTLTIADFLGLVGSYQDDMPTMYVDGNPPKADDR